jgi:primosomal protein N' (replication factor Y)
MPTVCDSCGAEHSFVACGPGVERIAEEVHARFPQARIELATSDSLHNPQDYEAMLHRILTKQADIIVGTQLMAKGHNFPDLTCVGIVDGDLGLFGGDLRATERTFQLLQQVAGRAGRHKKRGRVFIQSHEVGHPVMQAMQKQDQGQFMELEVENRKELGYPPFGRLAAVIVSGEHEAEVEQYCMALQRSVPKSESIRVLGPAIAPMAVLRGRHRRRFLIKSSLNQKLQAFLYHWVHLVKKNNNIRVQIDVDPYSFV